MWLQRIIFFRNFMATTNANYFPNGESHHSLFTFSYIYAAGGPTPLGKRLSLLASGLLAFLLPLPQSSPFSSLPKSNDK